MQTQISTHTFSIFHSHLVLPLLLPPSSLCPSQTHEDTHKCKKKKGAKRKETTKQKHISEKMMTEQLRGNGLACPFPAYQVTVWRYKFQPSHQPQSLPPTPKLKVACSSCGSGGNTFAHTCALFIFNRCRVEGPVQNGCHLSSINNSVTQAQTHREQHSGKHTYTYTHTRMKCHLTRR